MEEFKIEIEMTGGYEKKKEFTKPVHLTEREFLGLVRAILDFLDTLPIIEAANATVEKPL